MFLVYGTDCSGAWAASYSQIQRRAILQTRDIIASPLTRLWRLWLFTILRFKNDLRKRMRLGTAEGRSVIYESESGIIRRSGNRKSAHTRAEPGVPLTL